MLGCLEGEWVFVLDLLPLRSPAAPGGGLLSLNSDTFINLGLGVLNMVRFSRQRALRKNEQKQIQIIKIIIIIITRRREYSTSHLVFAV